MLTALFSVTFTSCIDNEVSPVVEAIYEAQADLIAAQANVQNAEAALLLAQAQQTEATAAYTAALTASVEIENAYATLENEQLLRELIAETDLAVAVAQNDLAEAQVQFDLDMAALMAELAEAGAVEAASYAAKYATHVGNVNTLTSTLIGKKATLALKELMLTGGTPNVSWEFYLAGLNSELATLEGDLAANLAAIEAYEEAMDNPTAVEAQKADLEAQIAALEDENLGLAVDIAEAENVRLAAAAELAAASAWITGTYDPAKLLVTDTEASKKTLVDANVILLKEIADLQLALADYPTALTNAETAVTDAQDAVDDAWLALGDGVAFDGYYTEDADDVAIAVGGTKYAAPANLQEVLVNATIDELNAQDEFDTLETAVSLLFATYQDAINALALAQSNYDAGIDALEATLLAAQGDLTTAEGDLATADAYYLAKKAIFEANTSGVTWFDESTPLLNTTPETSAYDNTKIGIHTDDALYTESYAYVTSWVEVGAAGSGDYEPTSLSATMVVAIPAGGTAYTGTVSEGAGNPAPSVTAATGYYVEVEADDLSETNAALLDDAVDKLGNEIPVDPVLGDVALLTTDAYSVVWNAQLAVIVAQDAIDTFDDALVIAQENYDTQKNLYENQVALMDDAEAILDAAITAQDTAEENVDNAWDALGDEIVGTPAAFDPADTLNKVLYNAELALAALEAYTDEDIQAAIDAKQADVDANLLLIAEYDILIAKYQADLDALEAQYDELVNTPLYASLQVALLEAEQAKAALEAQVSANAAMIVSLQAVIDAIDANYTLADYAALISGLESANATLATSIEAKKTAIAIGEITVEGILEDIAALEVEIAALEAQIANEQALADEYKALMEAALAS